MWVSINTDPVSVLVCIKPTPLHHNLGVYLCTLYIHKYTLPYREDFSLKTNKLSASNRSEDFTKYEWIVCSHAYLYYMIDIRVCSIYVCVDVL